MDRTRLVGIGLYGLAGWTLFVWGTRISNALGDAELSSGGKAFSIGLSVALIALAVAAVFARFRHHLMAARLATIFAWASVGVWMIRLPMIVLADHSVGFKVVHAVLGLVAIGLAAIVLWASRVASESSDPAGRR